MIERYAQDPLVVLQHLSGLDHGFDLLHRIQRLKHNVLSVGLVDVFALLR